MVKNDPKMNGASDSRNRNPKDRFAMDERRYDDNDTTEHVARVFVDSYTTALRDMGALLRDVTKDLTKVLEQVAAQQETEKRHE